MTTIAASSRAHTAPSATRSSGAVLPLPTFTYVLSGALAAVGAVGAFATFVFGGVLWGEPVMNGSCRGTALVMLVVTLPVMLVSMVLTRRGSARAAFVWFGMTLHLTYNTILLLLGEPLNRLFLVYEVMLTVAIAASVALAVTCDVRALASRCAATLPRRGLAIYLWAVVALNAVAWLGRILPAMIDDEPARLLDVTGLSMVPTYMGDLAIWLPFLALGAYWLWHGRPWGYLVVGGALAFWAVEGATVAVDQWFGHRADPASTVASSAAVVPFAVLSIIGVAATWVFLRHVDRATGPAA